MNRDLKKRCVNSRRIDIKSQLVNVCLLLIASILFAALFPNELMRFGMGFLAPLSLIPVAILIRRVSLYSAPVWGFVYGFSAYFLFNIWLGTFSPVAFLIVPPIYGVYFIVVFFFLKLTHKYFSNYGFLVHAVIWLLYEYLRTIGFLGYSFGVLGYAWSFYPLLIQTVDIFGVWGISFFIASGSFFIAQVLWDYTYAGTRVEAKESILQSKIETTVKKVLHILSRSHYKKFLVIYSLCGMFIIVYGIMSPKNYDDSPTSRISLLQHTTDPWKGGFSAYRKSLDKLIEESRRVLDGDNPPDLVVWSETAFVPSISYHLKYREVPEYTRLIKELYKFLQEYPDTEFLIGNGEGIKVKNKQGRLVRENYNATLFFRGDQKLDVYYKIHLVPFTEYFPYKDLLPRFTEFLGNYDVHFWLPGNEYTVFRGNTVNFSTPICFEDGFGLQNAKFVRAGAEVLVNVTNDAWSGVESNQMQHLQLSILRAVENRRSMVRSANAGMTAVIDPNGKISDMLDSYTVDALTKDVPIYTKTDTVYTRMGDWFVGAVTLIFLVSIFFSYYLRKKRK